MKRYTVRAAAAVGVASVAVLAAGPALAATVVSQATAQSVDLTVGGNSAVSQKVTATNDGKTQTKNDANTVPTLSSLLPGNTAANLGVAPQDAFANADGTSSACAGLVGQGGGIVQTGSAPCEMKQGQPVDLDLAKATLGDLLAANNNAALTPLTSALQAAFGPVNSAAVQPVLDALKAIPISAKITLDGVGATCQAKPGEATGDAGIAHLKVHLDIAGNGVDVIDLQADGSKNQKLVGDLSGASATLTKAIGDALKGAITPTGGGTLPIPGLPVGSALDNLLKTVQDSLLGPASTALKPLTDALSQNVLEVTFNKQPVPQKDGTFDVTSLNLQVLPAAQQAIGAPLLNGDIAHVTCGPNAALATTPPTSPSPSASKTPEVVPTGVDAGQSGGNAATAIAASSVLLAAAGGAGTVAYRRYWMPRG